MPKRDFVISKISTVIIEEDSVSPERSWLSGSQLLSNLREQLAQFGAKHFLIR